jgi:AcrR family transcriptional regulator
MTRLKDADVVRAGSRIVERVGARALTMRMLAAELGVSTMAAYRHVVSKTDLLFLIADDILSGVVIPPPETGEWDVTLAILESSAFDEISRVPDLWDLLPAGRTIPSEVRLQGAVADILIGAGFDRASVAWAQEAILGYVLGQMRLRTRHGHAADPDELQAHFTYGLRILLAGLKVELEAESSRVGRGTEVVSATAVTRPPGRSGR